LRDAGDELGEDRALSRFITHLYEISAAAQLPCELSTLSGNKHCVARERAAEVPMDEGLDNQISENAAGPRKAAGDSHSMEQHPLPDQIAADKYLESKKASRAKGLGIKLVKLAPGGSV
jgi:hypothetical protein